MEEIDNIKFAKETIKFKNNNNENEIKEVLILNSLIKNNELNWSNFLLMKWETTYNTKIILFQYSILFCTLLFLLFFFNYIIGIIINLTFIDMKFSSILLQISFEIFISTLFVNLVLMISNLIITTKNYFIFYKKKIYFPSYEKVLQ